MTVMVNGTHRRISARYHLSPSVEDNSFGEPQSTNIPGDQQVDPFFIKVVLGIMRRKLKPRQLAIPVLVLSFLALIIYILPSSISNTRKPSYLIAPNPTQINEFTAHAVPEPPSDHGNHPVLTLITNARAEFDELKAKQSKSLKEAVSEYRRRYGIPPPPNFDKWYDFAKKKTVILIDEYDTIHESLTPFWGLRPSVIRARAREALGYDNTLLGVLIREGNITRMEGGRDWMQKAIEGMTSEILKYLPDMDLCFNVYDEPRVVLPHDDLARLVRKAKTVSMPAANAAENPKNEFSGRPDDMNGGTYIDEIGRTRFNHLPYQATWTHSRLSCSPESPARSLEETEIVEDDVNSYAMGPLGFIYNHTAFTDICSSPSFSSSHGFFDGPNVFEIVQDLFPIFSQSKVSSFQDILYPSPWYWADKVPYAEETDISWLEKESKMYWRGATTGGHSRYGGWRRQHRQRFVTKINAQEHAQILTKSTSEASTTYWTTKEVYRPDYSGNFDVKFSEIGQCDKGDCTAQKEFFSVAPRAAPEDAWKSKFLLDVDGNAFSGRFYSFLMSKSLPFKLAIFREWHSELIKPWLHYVPLSLKGDEWLESIRWFASEGDGKLQAENLAMAGREWANMALRKEDMEVWFFRLLLEYGRLIDDDRENIGYVG